ncbi:Scr1 family TA system antitoxin-like transcriptional regulator [Actinopolyspora mortivallis]|uniref:Scr1 family TA system antitoxin-like transcriptional regulator n=1 Tax=Actinopolyspora mortivallis TaxID=33906 RepID=UPI0021599B70|nr:Scr1 family TA system antitoxin-like transcriptional regulator [Actinopolyspora mortivallis]
MSSSGPSLTPYLWRILLGADHFARAISICFGKLGHRLPWPTDPGVVYIEHRSGAVYLEDPTEIKAHTVAFEHLCAHALRPDESVAMMRNIAKEYGQ